MDKVRFGVIGCGYISRKAFIPALQKSNLSELVAVASRDLNKAVSFSTEYECDAENNYESLLNRNDISAVYIATVPSTHEEIILSAAKSGKHILCEKPLTISYNSAKKIVDCCKENNVNILEGFMYRFHSQHKRVRDLVDNGDIGKPILFTASFGIPKLDIHNFRYKLDLGGGACLDVGSYTIHAARHFFQREPIEIHSIIHNNGNEVDIHGAVTLDFGKGQTAQLAFGFNNFYRNTYSIWGTEGQVTLTRAFSIPAELKPKIILEKQKHYEEIICEPDDHFVKEIDYFCNRISKNNNYEDLYEDNIKQAKLIEHVIIKGKGI